MVLSGFFNRIAEFLYVSDAARAAEGTLKDVILLSARWLMPLLAVVIVVRIALSLLCERPEPELWAHLSLPDGSLIDINNWENILGRGARSDVVLNYPSVSKTHAALTRTAAGDWYIADAGSKGGTCVNGSPCKGRTLVAPGSIISLGGVDFGLVALSEQEARECIDARTQAGSTVQPALTLVMITLFQLISAVSAIMNVTSVSPYLFVIVYGGLIIVSWLYFIFMMTIRRTGLELEFIAFFLATLGLSATASGAPEDLLKQLVAFVLGLAVFMVLGFFLRDLTRSQHMRWICAAGCLGLIAAAFIFADEINGARNWLYIGGVSIQPSEIAKIAFVYAGSATLDRLLAKRNLILYIVFALATIGMLALMNDFGTAAIYFVTFVCIAFLRSGNISAIFLGGASAGLAGLLAVKFRPYVLNRFKAWRHVWEYSSSLGYQQTRTMMCAASGGLIGLGVGEGWLKYVAASDTDLVFGMLCEEQGLIIALCAVSLIVVTGVFCVRSSRYGRSSFYVIAACAAMCMLSVQTMLNVFGSVDIFPLTGVTFPFVSNGGSSMLASWGLLAFVKAVDTRRNASFAIKLRRIRKGRDEA